jgi:transposase InsO family protein
MGAKKLLIYLQAKFQAMNIRIGRDAFIELLYRNFMLVRRIRNKRKTTFSNHWMRKYPNLIRNYIPAAPNQLWVSDITYIQMNGRFVYLALVTDTYSHKIVGWELAPSLRACNALAALKMALKSLPKNHTGLIHHSDRGVQYCCSPYVKMLDKHTIRISMTESGDPLENAIAERINGILKTEWIYDRKLKSWQEALSFVRRIIDLYNNQRPHQSIGYMVPAFVHQTNLQTERKWKNYYQENNKTAK